MLSLQILINDKSKFLPTCCTRPGLLSSRRGGLVQLQFAELRSLRLAPEHRAAAAVRDGLTCNAPCLRSFMIHVQRLRFNFVLSMRVRRCSLSVCRRLLGSYNVMRSELVWIIGVPSREWQLPRATGVPFKGVVGCGRILFIVYLF